MRNLLRIILSLAGLSCWLFQAPEEVCLVVLFLVSACMLQSTLHLAYQISPHVASWRRRLLVRRRKTRIDWQASHADLPMIHFEETRHAR